MSKCENENLLFGSIVLRLLLFWHWDFVIIHLSLLW